jgi:ribonuclease HI
MKESNKLLIYIDGGSRGNPGEAAIGVLIGEKGYGEYIGKATNNVAEYKALIFALKKAKALLGSKKAKETVLEIRSDSELLVNQLNGLFKIKEKNLGELFIEVWNLKQDFKQVIFKKIPREENKETDKIVNNVLNKLI